MNLQLVPRRRFNPALLAGGLLLLLSASLGWSGTVSEDIAQLLGNTQPIASAVAANPAPTEAARYSLTGDQYLSYLGAPPQHSFPSPLPPGTPPEVIAHDFLVQHGRVFGSTSSRADFSHLKTRTSDQRHYVRLQQTYSGLPVFASQTTVQVSEQGGVESVLSHIARDFKVLDENLLSTNATVTAEQAIATATQAVTNRTGGSAVETTAPALTIFAPSVMGEQGELRLVWEFKLNSADYGVNEQFLVDAHSGAILQRYALVHTALNRQVYDSNGTTNEPGTLVRSEGQSASGITDADNAYQFLGDTYNFYFVYHGRDSIDGAGEALSATVRRCQTPANGGCPWPNAAWSGGRMRFGAGYAVEDVTGHELTHGVTASTSALIYQNASGAINESFSDVWGEFIEQTFSSNLNATNRWLMGQNLPGGAIRSMKDPTIYNNPDRLGSPLYYTGTVDNGGVHNNSGVNNKLCYLLTDGDTFNGQTVYGRGIVPIAKLYYEVNAHLLTSGANWTDLYNALVQAAVNLSWNTADRNNLYRACLAVEIATGGNNLFVDRTSSCGSQTGSLACSLFSGPFLTVGQGVASANPADQLFIRAGNYNEQITFQKIMKIQAYGGLVTIGH